MDPTYSVVEIQCLKTGWVYIDMWKHPCQRDCWVSTLTSRST